MFKKILITIFVGVLALSLSADIYAGGGKRNGTSGAEELLLPVSARGIAMGGAYLSGLKGIDAVFYNPAGLTVSNRSTEAMFSYMNYIADIGYSYAAVGVNFDSFGSLGLSIRSLDFGDIPVTTTENPYGTGATFSPTYVTVGITYANHLTDRIRVGFTINLISQTIQRTSASGFAFDAGIQYNGVGGVDGLQFGIVVKNLGPQIKFDGPDLLRRADEIEGVRGTNYYKIDAAYSELPSQLELGLAYEKLFADTYNLIVAASFQNNNFANDEYHFAAEFGFNNLLFLRGGYSFVSEAMDNEDEYLFGPTFGAGFHLDGSLAVTVDYAYRWARYFDANHMVTVKLGF